jgi:beta-N-acetylhexosaminidase
MGGILKFLSVDEAAVAAVRAGTDLMLICHSSELILRAYETLLREAEKSAAFRTLLQRRARDAASKRARLFAKGPAKPITPTQLLGLKNRLLRFADLIVDHTKGDAIDPRAASPAETS